MCSWHWKQIPLLKIEQVLHFNNTKSVDCRICVAKNALKFCAYIFNYTQCTHTHIAFGSENDKSLMSVMESNMICMRVDKIDDDPQHLRAAQRILCLFSENCARTLTTVKIGKNTVFGCLLTSSPLTICLSNFKYFHVTLLPLTFCIFASFTSSTSFSFYLDWFSTVEFSFHMSHRNTAEVHGSKLHTDLNDEEAENWRIVGINWLALGII